MVLLEYESNAARSFFEAAESSWNSFEWLRFIVLGIAFFV